VAIAKIVWQCLLHGVRGLRQGARGLLYWVRGLRHKAREPAGPGKSPLPRLSLLTAPIDPDAGRRRRNPGLDTSGEGKENGPVLSGHAGHGEWQPGGG
jgi:hypothetical protein